MKIFIVYWHPEPQSFNGSMFRTACKVLVDAGHEVRTSDLHEMRFDPVSSRKNFTTVKDQDYFKQQIEEMHATETKGFSAGLEAEMEKLEWCDLMVWQFPLWWFGLPAVLKGWVDRVFAMGRIYGYGHIYETGVFRGKQALLSLTTGGQEEAYRHGGFNGDVSGVLRPFAPSRVGTGLGLFNRGCDYDLLFKLHGTPSLIKLTSDVTDWLSSGEARGKPGQLFQLRPAILLLLNNHHIYYPSNFQA